MTSRATTRPVESLRPSASGRRPRAVATLAVVVALTITGCAGPDEPGTSAASASSATPEAAATTAPAAGTNRIAAPADGSTVTGPGVEVTGEGTAFEATLLWRVLGAGTADVVAEDFTTAGANGEVGPFAFTVELAPGTYTLEVWEPDLADGADDSAAGDRHGLVRTTFTVS